MTARSVRPTDSVTSDGTTALRAALHTLGVGEEDRVVTGEDGRSVLDLARGLDHLVSANGVGRLVKTE